VLDEVSPAGPRAVRVRGWAVDPDTAEATDVHLYAQPVGRPPGTLRAVARASEPRPDVGAALPGWGAGHGFDLAVPLDAGPAEVCAYAVDRSAPGDNRLLGCRAVVVPS
jgi:hypothetical protein